MPVANYKKKSGPPNNLVSNSPEGTGKWVYQPQRVQSAVVLENEKPTKTVHHTSPAVPVRYDLNVSNPLNTIDRQFFVLPSTGGGVFRPLSILLLAIATLDVRVGQRRPVVPRRWTLRGVASAAPPITS